jgi:hypothetical protein
VVSVVGIHVRWLGTRISQISLMSIHRCSFVRFKENQGPNIYGVFIYLFNDLSEWSASVVWASDAGGRAEFAKSTATHSGAVLGNGSGARLLRAFLKTLAAEESRLAELIDVLERGGVVTAPPRPPTSVYLDQASRQLELIQRLREAYCDEGMGCRALN